MEQQEKMLDSNDSKEFSWEKVQNEVNQSKESKKNKEESKLKLILDDRMNIFPKPNKNEKR